MPYKLIATSYQVFRPAFWNDKVSVAMAETGWSQAGLTNKAIEEYFEVTAQHYIDVARLDADARGYDEPGGDYYEALESGELAPWADNLRPDFPQSPLARITDCGNARKNQHRLKQIKTSTHNAVLVRLVMEVEDLTLIQFTSRVVVWHFARHWDKQGGYNWQITAAEQGVIEPD
jgi:hypothetical protein